MVTALLRKRGVSSGAPPLRAPLQQHPDSVWVRRKLRLGLAFSQQAGTFNFI